MNERVLFVDDEPNVLDGLRRQLRRRYAVEIAVGGEEGLRMIDEGEPFAVVVSDMRMPGMDGAAFLSRVREAAPDSIRMILSGQAELDSTIAAVNEGHIFRFLTKPCPVEALSHAVDSALEQYRLVHAERQLLEQTLSGSVKVLTEILSLTNPTAFTRSSRVEHYVGAIVESLAPPEAWQYRLAAMLCQVGCVTLSAETLRKLDAGGALSDEERRMVETQARVAGELLERIPRLGTVAKMVAGQDESVDPTEMPPVLRDWPAEVLGAQIVRAALTLDRLLAGGVARAEALERLRAPDAQLPAAIVDAIAAVPPPRASVVTRSVTMSELAIGMVLDQDVVTKSGMRIAPSGQEITDVLRARLQNFAGGIGVVEPVRVLVGG